MAEIYDRHASGLYGFLLSFSGGREAEARDALQEVFVRLATRPDVLRGVRDERAFLLRVAYRLAVDAARRRGTRARHEERFGSERVPLFAPAADSDAAAYRAALDEALCELPAEQRAVVHLKLWEGLTFEAIAVALDIPANTAASRYRYGLDKLRARLRPVYEAL